jgi:hypothetical protein
VRGALTEAMTAIHNGRALSVAIDVSRGNTAKRTMTIAPLATDR